MKESKPVCGWPDIPSFIDDYAQPVITDNYVAYKGDIGIYDLIKS